MHGPWIPCCSCQLTTMIDSIERSSRLSKFNEKDIEITSVSNSSCFRLTIGASMRKCTKLAACPEASQNRNRSKYQHSLKLKHSKDLTLAGWMIELSDFQRSFHGGKSLITIFSISIGRFELVRKFFSIASQAKWWSISRLISRTTSDSDATELEGDSLQNSNKRFVFLEHTKHRQPDYQSGRLCFQSQKMVWKLLN